jgi:hypothetical protein
MYSNNALTPPRKQDHPFNNGDSLPLALISADNPKKAHRTPNPFMAPPTTAQNPGCRRVHLTPSQSAVHRLVPAPHQIIRKKEEAFAVIPCALSASMRL